MSRTTTDAKRAATMLLALRQFPSTIMDDPLRREMLVSAPWPPVAAPETYVRDALGEMGYTVFEDWSIVRDTVAHPTAFGVNAASAACLMLYLGIIDPGAIWSSRQALRDEVIAATSPGSGTVIGIAHNWGYLVNGNGTFTRL